MNNCILFCCSWCNFCKLWHWIFYNLNCYEPPCQNSFCRCCWNIATLYRFGCWCIWATHCSLSGSLVTFFRSLIIFIPLLGLIVTHLAVILVTTPRLSWKRLGLLIWMLSPTLSLSSVTSVLSLFLVLIIPSMSSASSICNLCFCCCSNWSMLLTHQLNMIKISFKLML